MTMDVRTRDTDRPSSCPPLAAFTRRDLVPYITAWSSERGLRQFVVARGASGIGYLDENPFDRDSKGVLWSRVASTPGSGRPEFGKVHSLRQRRAMLRRLCQICARPAVVNQAGVLWLLGGEHRETASLKEIDTTHPPVCLPCARTSVRACPHLRRRFVALRVRRSGPAGVEGVRYAPGGPLPSVIEGGGFAYGDRCVRWVRAAQLIVRLRSFTVVDLDAEQSGTVAGG